MSQTKWWLISLIILGVAGGWILYSSRDPNVISNWNAIAPRSGFSAPEIELETPSGEPVKLSDLKGKSIVLNFWASWCPPCRVEMPALQNIYSEYQEQDVVVLGINSTYNDSMTKAIEFVQLNQLSFPILLDTSGTASKDYQVNSLPTTYFVDPNGVIRDVIIGGPISETILKSKIEALQSGKID